MRHKTDKRIWLFWSAVLLGACGNNTTESGEGIGGTAGPATESSVDTATTGGNTAPGNRKDSDTGSPGSTEIPTADSRGSDSGDAVRPTDGTADSGGFSTDEAETAPVATDTVQGASDTVATPTENPRSCTGEDPNSQNGCTPQCRCQEGQGDCDGDADCAPGLVCAQDVGEQYGFVAMTDVCVPPPEDTQSTDVVDSTVDTEEACDLVAPLSWVSTGPLVGPQNVDGHDFLSVKDPTIVRYQGVYHVFATAYDDAYRSVYFSFSDWSQAQSARHQYMGNWPTGNTVAPQVFYFAPQGLWYLIFQWPARYATNPDITNPSGWSAPRRLLDGEPEGALDFWVICDDATCHLFFSRDDGTLYRSKTPIDNFPHFSGYEVVMSEPNAGDLFEASNVYKLKGQNKYLLMVECYAPRYFRSWTSSSLDGPWTPLADTRDNPFAGEANVSWPDGQWTRDISHGEMIRAGYDQTMEIDPCTLQFLYQGYDPNQYPGGDYNTIPYRLGLLTLHR